LPLETGVSKLETAAVRWKKVTLMGVGLLGGSLGLALKRACLAECVTGFVRRKASVAECLRFGAVDSATRDLKTAVEGADLVILCTPIAQMRPLVERFEAWLQPGALVTDVGSVKAAVVAALEPIVARAGGRFVGSHPMAGSEKTGVAAARQDLFEGAVCVVTPTKDSDQGAVRRVATLWRSLGMRVLKLPPPTHDRLVSRTSHLPQILASHLASFVLDPRQPKAQTRLCAAGFRDTTRLASSSSEMWRDIALANRGEILGALDGYLAALRGFRDALDTGDAEAVRGFFARASRRRNQWLGRAE
jgi:prephenate dehydrogenase